jgi:hypothetical protein
MTQVHKLITGETKTASIDVLFVTNQLRIPGQIKQLLDEKNLSWGKVTVEGFAELAEDLKNIGTVIADTTEVTEILRPEFCRTIQKLESRSIGAILFNNKIDFPFSNFKLATYLESLSIDEIWGRIETNIAYCKSLLNTPVNIPPESTDLAEDTAEQLKMAGQVQRNFLPRRLPQSDRIHWSTIFVPADWVSGDIYDITRLDEHHIGFYVADAVGHSMPAALLTMFVKHTMRMRETRDNDYQIFTPAKVIGNLNAQMVEQDLAGCLFATCCYCLLNIDTMTATFARAGHPYPVLIRKGQKPLQLENRGGLLGVFAENVFEEKTIQLQQHDKLFLYSDGCESLVGTTDQYGKFNFTEQFLSLAELDIDNMTEKFEQIVRSRKPAPGEIDDVTVLGMQIL